MPADPDKRKRIFEITDETYKVLCQADRKNLNPSVGLEGLVAMYLALNGPVDFEHIDLKRALLKAQQDIFN